MGKMFFNILATFAEFEVDLLRLRSTIAEITELFSVSRATAYREIARAGTPG